MHRGPEAPTLSDGRYTLTRRLGEGGMASVFLAWDNKLKVWRAIKVLLQSVVSKKKVRKRFENEAHAMARLEHPHIVRIYDVGSENNVPYMVMELAEGGCVIDWLARYGPMPSRLAVDVVVQICKGIRAAHAAGIVHRDIKPHNVLVNSKGICKVTDFGIAQVMDIDTLTKTGSVMGTWGYMAPEQRTDAKNIDERADVFAIGATLYTLLTSKTPTELYVADEDDEVFEGIPPELLEVITTACRYKPAARYPDVKTLGMAVYRAGTTQPQVPPSTPSLVLTHDPLPESVESAPLSPTILQDLNNALGRHETTAPDDEDEPPPPQRSATTNPGSPRRGPVQTEPNKVLPYYMPSKPSRSNPGTSGAFRSDFGPVPDYIDQKDPSNSGAFRSPPTPPPAPSYEPTPTEPDVEEEEGSSTSDILIKLSVLPLFLLLVVIGMLGYGMSTVNASATVAFEEAARLDAKLAQPGPLVDALGQAGADRRAIEEAYLAYADAAADDRTEQAIAFVETLRTAANANDGVPKPILREIESLHTKSEEVRSARDAWSDSADSFLGGLAVTFGLTQGPG
jgi:serine/threonine-protein kinase